MPAPEGRDNLIRAATRAANRPSEHHVTELLRAVFDLPISEWPKEFDEIPRGEFRVPGSLGLWLARYAALVAAEQKES